jgi:predicted MFS family arabinose efflux permease
MLNEFRRGGAPLLGSMVGAGCGLTSVVFYTHGVFAVPITAATGWLRSEVQFAFTLMSLMAVLTAPAVGWAIDRLGARRVALCSIVTFFLGYSLLSLTGSSLGGYYAAFIAMAVLGAGTLPVTWTTVVNQWFYRNRGLALGIALTGTGIAATVAPAYAGWLIAERGWQAAYFWLALTATVIALPVVALLFRSPAKGSPAGADDTPEATALAAELDAGSSVADALRSYRLWVLCLAVGLVAGSVAGMITSFVALLTDKGFSLTEAASFASAIGLSVIFGRLVSGFLVDRIWAPAVAAVLLICPAAAAIALDIAPMTPVIATACAALIGLAAGAELDLLAFLTSRYFGLRRYGSIYAITFVFFSVSAGLAPATFGLVYDWTGTYSVALRCAAVGCVVGAAALLTLGPYPSFLSRGDTPKR